jgi:hypothetical protein
MRPTTRTRRALTTAVAGAGLVLALGACSTGDEEPEAADQQSDETSETSAAPGAEAVAAARAGLEDWLEANQPSSTEEGAALPDCPAISVAALEEALAGAGHPDITLAGWGTEIEWSEYEQLHPDLVGFSCGGDSDGDTEDAEFGTAAGVLAVDLAGKTTYEDFITAVGLEDLRDVEPPQKLGGDVQTTCFPDGPDFCAAFWHRDGLVVGLTLIAEGVEAQTPADMLVRTLPRIIDNLAKA